MVRRLLRITLIVSLGLLLVLAGGALAFWKALHQVPEFYQEALRVTPRLPAEANDQIFPEETAPAGDAQQQESGSNALLARAEVADAERPSQAAPAALPVKTDDERPPSRTPPGSTPEQKADWNTLFHRAENLASQRQSQGSAATSQNGVGDEGTPLRRSQPLANDQGKEGRWNALFTAPELNSWLAVNVQEHFAKTAHGSLNDLRVAIEPYGVAVGCRLEQGRVNTVLSFSGDAELVGNNVIAVRIRQARAGAVPLRTDDVVKPICKAASCCGLQVDWQQRGGDPVALITLPLPRGAAAGPVQLDTLQLGEGEAWLSGSSPQR